MPKDAVTLAPDLEEYKKIARQSAMDYFVGEAMQDKRPPTQRAMDVYKVGEARAVMAGGASTLLEAEAAERGVPVKALANMVLAEGRKSEELELKRVRVSLAVDRATTLQEVADALLSNGVML